MNIDIRTTTIVKAIVWFLVGQETCFSSPCVSFRYVINDMILYFSPVVKNPSGGMRLIILFLNE